jgi:uncharacterized protein (UPF0332 family)
MPSIAFDWAKYLTLAEELGRRTDEASLRSAISRAYYYVYHLALARAEANDFRRLAGESTHTQLWRIFSASPEPDCRRLADIALRLKEKRERADYDNHFSRLTDEVPAQLEEAQTFASLLTKLPPRHPNPRSVRQ